MKDGFSGQFSSFEIIICSFVVAVFDLVHEVDPKYE